MSMLEQYGNKYIRYDGGQIVEEIIQVKITDEECESIKNDQTTMEKVVNDYSHRGFCDYEVLRDNLMKDYLLSVGNYSEERLDMIIDKLKTYKKVYREFYDYVLYEDYAERPLKEEGMTAQYLAENYPLSPLGAFNYLIYLHEKPQQALADLKAGLPRK